MNQQKIIFQIKGLKLSPSFILPLVLLFLFLFSFVYSNNVYALKIKKVKNKSVLIEIESEDEEQKETLEGQEFVSLSETGRKIGLIRISKVKNNLAVGILKKGIAASGQKLVAKPNSKSRFKEDPTENNESSSEEDSEADSSTKSKSISIFAGYGIDTMNFTAYSAIAGLTDNVTLAGTSFKLKGFYDFRWKPNLFVRLGGGLDGFNGQFTTSKTQINSDGSTTSKLNATNIALEGSVLWSLYQKNNSNFYLDGGYSFIYTASSTTNILSLSLSSAYSNVIHIGSGYNIGLKNNKFIPLLFNYNYYIISTGITQSNISFYGGYGWSF